jgi:hypothetical protein
MCPFLDVYGIVAPLLSTSGFPATTASYNRNARSGPSFVFFNSCASPSIVGSGGLKSVTETRARATGGFDHAARVPNTAG